MEKEPVGGDPRVAPRPIAPMSLQRIITQRVVLEQSLASASPAESHLEREEKP
jgi:hypothetical protein